MPNKPKPEKLHRWRVRLIRSNAARDLGWVHAETEADAIDIAMRDKGIPGQFGRSRVLVSLDD